MKTYSAGDREKNRYVVYPNFPLKTSPIMVVEIAI